jgi:tRNA(fMet)-specific endonuclease VapC
MYFLDTNICAFILNGKYPELNERYIEFDRRKIKIPSVVLFELYYGAEKSQKRERNLANIKTFISELEIVPFDNKAAEIAGKIRSDLDKSGQLIGGYDLMIAATALANNGFVVTNNTREFSRINGLSVEDWSVSDDGVTRIDRE